MSIPREFIIRQLKADLIGKDSYRGVTLTYSWLANQFGHFSLGFIPTFILFVILSKFPDISNPAIVAAIVVSIIWLLFELYNFLKPLLFNKSSKLVSLVNNKYVFKPAWSNIAFDTFTDLCFFWIGAFTASEICKLNSKLFIVISILAIMIIRFSYYWYLTKMYLQIAEYPFQFRLSQWNSNISEENKNTVNSYLSNKNSGQHLLVFGSRRSGKTSISVGIATEMSIKHKSCTYITAMKLYSMFFEADEKLLTETASPWTWRTASFLLIDDINPGDPIEEELVDPKTFLKFMDTNGFVNDANRKIIKEKNIIWVLGNEDQDKALLLGWQNMLENIGVDKQNIHSINLQSNNLI